MSLIFEQSNVISKTMFGQVFLQVLDSEKQAEKAAEPIDAIERVARVACNMGHNNSISMTYDDFCGLVIYFLTNEDLHPDDVRLELIKRIAEHKIIEGWNPEQKRVSIHGEDATWSY